MNQAQVLAKLEEIKATHTCSTSQGMQAGPFLTLIQQLIEQAKQNPLAVISVIQAIVAAFGKPNPPTA